MTTQVANPPVQSIRLLFSALLLVMLLSALDQTIVSTALPTIVGELGGLDKLSWVVTAYILSSTIAVPLYGKFGDLFGRKIVLQVAIGLFLVGSALCGLAQNMTQLVLMRGLQGLGGGGLLLTSIISGRIISRTGKYRLFPILGTLLGVTGMVLLTRITIHSPLWQLYLFTGVLGAGLGLVMQVLVLAVQNAMPAQMYGVATSGVTLFRSIGGSIGVALFGAVFTHVLQSNLQQLLPEGAVLPPGMNPVAVQHLPADIRLDYLDAFGAAIHAAFLMAAGIMAVAFVLSWLLKEAPLKTATH
ncbi:MAG: MFS transporter [Klebsiella pneumoniae]